MEMNLENFEQFAKNNSEIIEDHEKLNFNDKKILKEIDFILNYLKENDFTASETIGLLQIIDEMVRNAVRNKEHSLSELDLKYVNDSRYRFITTLGLNFNK